MSPIIATANDSKSYEPCPAGTHHAVCADVIDLGMKPNPFKPGAQQHKIDIAWQVSELREDGKRFVVYKRYTLSLNEKATLRHDLESWRGKPFTEDELRGFDVERLIGANGLVNIQHHVSGDKTYANVVAVTPLIKGMVKMAPEGYERRAAQQTAPEPEPAPEMVPDDEIPF